LALSATLVFSFTYILQPSASSGLAIVVVSALMAVALHLCLACWARPSPLERHLAEYAAQLKSTRRRSWVAQACEKGPGRAVQAGQLTDFHIFFEPFILLRSTYYLVPNIVRPLTAECRLSFAEFIGSRQVEWFVSHYWGTSFSDFVCSIRCHAKHYSQKEWRNVSYWVCSLSNNQWRIKDEMGASWEQSSFYLALKSQLCVGTAMVLDAEAMPLTRAWCLFELLQTQRLMADDSCLCFCTSSGVLQEGHAGIDVAVALARHLASVRLEEAHASCQSDKDMIFGLVQSMPGGFDAMNAFVRHIISNALRVMKVRFDSDFQLVLDSLEPEDEPYDPLQHVMWATL